MTVVRARTCPNHMSEVAGLIIAIAGHCFGLMDASLRRYSAIELPQRFVRCPACLVERDRQINAVILHALETTDRLPEDDALARIFVGEFKYFLAGADLIGAKYCKRFFQSLVDDLPAGAGADYVSSRYLHLFELNFRHRDGKSRVNT